MKIFFYGGTFDPPHLGHMKIVERCLSRCDKLIILPNKQSPDKMNYQITPSAHRFNMLNLIFKSEKIYIDLFELNSDKINYTYLTIEYLKKKYCNSSITMILGYDQWSNFENWKKKDQILNTVNIICFNRKISKNKKQNKDFEKINFIDDFNVDISSVDIRRKIINSDRKKYSNFLHEKIINYIIKHKLYVS